LLLLGKYSNCAGIEDLNVNHSADMKLRVEEIYHGFIDHPKLLNENEDEKSSALCVLNFDCRLV